MATYRQQQQQFIYSICMASKQCRERKRRERAVHTLSLDSIVCQFSLHSSCFPLSLPLALSLSCRLLVDQQGNALESAFISGQASLAPLFFSFFFFLFLLSLLLLLFMIYAHRRTHPIAALLNCFAWQTSLGADCDILLNHPPPLYHHRPPFVTFTQCVLPQVGQCRRGWPEGCCWEVQRGLSFR